jgi:NadR type nicotinamide-nucleotide adenylyltransferase
LSLKKIVVIGPESTGKSTLSQSLANALNTLWVPEYAREYLELLGRPYAEEDLLEIAKGQLASEGALAANANGLLVCDTDLNVIKVWSEHRYSRCNSYITDQIARREYHLYLLTGIDIPWQPDPLREHPDEAMRQYFYSKYASIVAGSGVPWFAINGDEAQRLKKALEAMQSMGWQ